MTNKKNAETIETIKKKAEELMATRTEARKVAQAKFMLYANDSSQEIGGAIWCHGADTVFAERRRLYMKDLLEAVTVATNLEEMLASVQKLQKRTATSLRCWLAGKQNNDPESQLFDRNDLKARSTFLMEEVADFIDLIEGAIGK